MEQSANARQSTLRSRTQELNTLSVLSKDVSLEDAKKYWKDRQADGKVDWIFEKVLNKLKILWQKIKDGSATNLEYVRAVILVNEAGNLEEDLEEDLKEDTDTIHIDIHKENEVQENTDCSPERKEDTCLNLNTDCGTDVSGSEPECNSTVSPPAAERVYFGNHSCGPSCLSGINSFLFTKGNPLQLPISCDFQRCHLKINSPDDLSHILYKAPCGRSLRDYDEVHSYLTETGCHFLAVDNFSFNNHVRLDSNSSFNQGIVQDCDISNDVESVPVAFSNEIDNTRPSNFIYRKTSWPPGYSLNNFTDIFVKCCNCTDGCLDILTCSCLQLTAQAFTKCMESSLGIGPLGYKHKRLQEPIPTGLYECNVSCKCDRMLCQNRVVQHGLKLRLQVFKTNTKGWGVRCLDDVDKGTFVCIYAGRILIRTADCTVKSTPDDSVACGNEDHEDSTSTCALILSKRKRKTSHSDSEVTIMHTNPYSMRSHGLSVHRLSNTFSPTQARSGGREFSLQPLRRPKTKTSMLQKRRRQLIEEGACTVQNSSEEEGPTPPQSPEQKSSAGTKIQRNENSDETASGYVSEESSSSVISGGHPLEKPISKFKSKLNKTTVYLSTSPVQTEENLHFLDASKEGNVGRFLNHSCCPNLFVQQVFVDTHQKCFPWVAFFTNSVVKAGTELTWDYSYDIGTAADQEIQCLCGQQTCKNKVV
ncbi:hypothetical protein XELAEV_18016106mg [Xenopus laevis]|uniref:Histone-lysine N-methyltransferase SETDB2 n=1 Tax=Xenopus laevis TaxID=8355 RepID=A0A974DKG4_XENLA|nr:hypothetical protein XELAEV_18016106mg [Xenopus laevis]OCT93041.1 hypothetical protein XELAEV_18016106mg [Xenopus laevis]